MRKALTDIHLLHRLGPEESLFDDDIKDFGDHEDDTRDNSK